MNPEVSFRADLHCHTFYSDGSDSPETLLHHAKEIGLRGLAITDHDTIEAYANARPFADQLGIHLLSGVEFSAFHRNEPVHILAYAFPLNSEPILSFCERHQRRREMRNLKILEKLKALGIVIEKEELDQHPGLSKRKTIGRPHIAMAMIAKGVVGSIREAFQKYLGEGKVAYDPGERISPEETLKIIHQVNGKAIIAHPHLLVHRAVIKDLLSMPFDGLEGYYALMPKHQQDKWVKTGQEKGWMITGGSDYHGSIKPQNPLGGSWVDKITFDRLYEHFLNH